MVVIREPDSLKCNILFGTFGDETIKCCLDLPQLSTTNYQHLMISLVDKFSTSKDR